MNENLPTQRPEKTEAEIASQIGRITDNLGRRAMEGMGPDAVFIPYIEGDGLTGLHSEDNTSIRSLETDEENENRHSSVVKEGRGSLRLEKSERTTAEKPAELPGEYYADRSKDVRVEVNGDKVSGTYTHEVRGWNTGNKTNTHAVELTRGQQVSAAASILSNMRSKISKRRADSRAEASDFIKPKQLVH